MRSVKEALATAGAGDDLQGILQVLEDGILYITCWAQPQAAVGLFFSVAYSNVSGLDIRMLCVIKRAQQQQYQLERLEVVRMDWLNSMEGYSQDLIKT